MAKSSTSKTNGHTVAALKPAAPRKRAARAAPDAEAVTAPARATRAAAKAPARRSATAAKTAPKTAPKTAARPAAKSAVKPAAKPAARTAAGKAAVKSASKTASKTAPKTASKAAVKPAAKAPARTSTSASAKKTSKVQDVVKPVRKSAVSPAPQAEQVDDARERSRKAKLVRDSFTMPEQEYAVLGQVKKACLKAGFDIKKSELLRIGVALISQLDMATLQKVLGSLPQLKTGRPKSE